MYDDLKEQYLDIIQKYMTPNKRNNMLANMLTLRNLAKNTSSTKKTPSSSNAKKNQNNSIKPILVHDAAQSVLRMSTAQVKKTLDAAAEQKAIPKSVVTSSKAAIDKKGKKSWSTSMKKWSLSALMAFLLLSPQGVVQNYNAISILNGKRGASKPHQLTQLGRTYISKNHGKNPKLLNGTVFQQHVKDLHHTTMLPTKKANHSNYASVFKNTIDF